MNQMNGLTDLCAHGQARTEAEDAHQHRELLPVRPQEAGPVVHEAGHQGLHVAELRVHPEDLEDKVLLMTEATYMKRLLMCTPAA